MAPPRPAPPPAPEAHLADAGHPGRAELVEELKLAGRLLEEEVDDLGRRDGGDEGGVRCRGGQRGLATEHLGAPCCKPWGWLPRPREGRPRVPPLVEGGRGPGRRGLGLLYLRETNASRGLGQSPSLRYPSALNVACGLHLGVERIASSPAPGKARPALSGARPLTLQPAEESVGLEDRLGSQRADQDGLAAQEVVHGARVECPVCGAKRRPAAGALPPQPCL